MSVLFLLKYLRFCSVDQVLPNKEPSQSAESSKNKVSHIAKLISTKGLPP